MLLELLVENYAVIEKIRIRFQSGFNVLTGETGSGKSIVVDALGLLLGGRASAEMIRTGAGKARISGIFDLPAAATGMLHAAGVDLDGEELIIDREILAGGKSRAWISSRPVTAALLKDLAPFLGDIHGQHEQQRLFSRDAQLGILDDFGGLHADLEEVRRVFQEWRACDLELKELDRAGQERLRLFDLWKFQRNEIEASGLRAGEDEKLESERRVLQNFGKISEGAATAYASLYDAPESASAQLRTAGKRLEDLRRIDEELGRIAGLLKPVEIALDEAASELRDYIGRLEADPDRLEEVEGRLAAIDKLKRKYGGSVAEILAFLAEVTSSLDAAENASDHRASIEKRRAQLAAQYEAAARDLSSKRREAAAGLSKGVQHEVRSLAMERAVFEVLMEETAWSATGLDAVQFLVSANVGEAPKPMERIASGGELSRIALALRTCVTGGESGRTLVFDEVDAGIGGAAAASVGKRLKALASRDQVLCVTHLAQIAGFGDHHYAVEKRESNGRTTAVIEELEGASRTREVGRMLSGQLTPEALKHAEQLLRAGTH